MLHLDLDTAVVTPLLGPCQPTIMTGTMSSFPFRVSKVGASDCYVFMEVGC